MATVRNSSQYVHSSHQSSCYCRAARMTGVTPSLYIPYARVRVGDILTWCHLRHPAGSQRRRRRITTGVSSSARPRVRPKPSRPTSLPGYDQYERALRRETRERNRVIRTARGIKA